MKELREFKCGCCGITYEIELQHYEMSPIGCTACQPHLHARTAEELLRQRADHGALWNANLADMNERIVNAEQRMSSAYHTRGLALGVLNRINAAHDMRPDGSCSCKVKSCKVGPIIAGERVLLNLIRSYDAREQKRLARIRREEGLWEYSDEWDGLIDDHVVTPAKPESGEASETA